MKRIAALGLAAAITLLATTLTTGAPSASDPSICLKTCIETYGADKKQACALQCGFGSGTTGAGQTKDCGTVFKQCLSTCGNDRTCQDRCRTARTQCF